jgi:hypothetical protein
MLLKTKPIYPTNEEFRRLRAYHRLSIDRLVDILTASKWGGPSDSAVNSWLANPAAKNYNRMPGNSLDIFIIRLDEAGYRED